MVWSVLLQRQEGPRTRLMAPLLSFCGHFIRAREMAQWGKNAQPPSQLNSIQPHKGRENQLHKVVFRSVPTEAHAAAPLPRTGTWEYGNIKTTCVLKTVTKRRMLPQNT